MTCADEQPVEQVVRLFDGYRERCGRAAAPAATVGRLREQVTGDRPREPAGVRDGDVRGLRRRHVDGLVLLGPLRMPEPAPYRQRAITEAAPMTRSPTATVASARPAGR